jgi:hypothetical protein
VFCGEVEFASRKSACKFNKLICILVIRQRDRAMRCRAFSREFATLDAMRVPRKMRPLVHPQPELLFRCP